MDLHQIECVVAISEFRNFTKAAKHLHVSQSGLSYTVGRLETELGVPLFARLGREVVLTTAGEAFLPGARGALVASRAAREAAVSVGGLFVGELGLVASSMVKHFAAEAVADFNRRHPQVRISLSIRYPTRVAEMVRSSTAPMAIVGMHDVPRQLETHELFEDEVVVLFPPGTDHPATVRVEDLDQYQLIVLRQAIAEREQQADPSLFPNATVVAETDDIDALYEMILGGVGAAILAQDSTTGAVARGATIATLEPRKSYKVALVHRPGRLTPVEEAFHAIAAERAQQLKTASAVAK